MNWGDNVKHQESAEQVALFQWAEYNKGFMPQLKLLYHIPNGGKRNVIEAARLKREGVKAGVPDIHLPVRCNNYSGLWLEMKAPKGKLSENQKNWIEELEGWGHKVVVCYNWVEAKEAIESYIKGVS